MDLHQVIKFPCRRIEMQLWFINHSCDCGNLSASQVRSSGALIPKLFFYASLSKEIKRKGRGYHQLWRNRTAFQVFAMLLCRLLFWYLNTQNKHRSSFLLQRKVCLPWGLNYVLTVGGGKGSGFPYSKMWIESQVQLKYHRICYIHKIHFI